MLAALHHLNAARFDTPAVLKRLATASRQLAGLKGIAATIPDPGTLINTLDLQEAKDSSEIENIVTTHDELFRGDANSEVAATTAAKEVLRYRQALRVRFELVRSDRLLTVRLEAAGLETLPPGPHEEKLRKAIGRMLHVDDAPRLNGYLQLPGNSRAPDTASLPQYQQRLLRMLAASVASTACPQGVSLNAAVKLLWEHPAVISELVALFRLLQGRISHVGKVLAERPDVPLTVHARYSRLEIQAAFGDGGDEKAGVPPWREGVRWMESANCDVFLVTSDKTGAGFSPTTRYRDYAISRDLVHWESQSRTRASDPTGTRSRTHLARGSAVMMFARMRGDERGFHFLGPAGYVTHQSDMPMQVTWKLAHPLPGDLFATFAAAVA